MNLVEQIRYLTREGMKTAVRKGKSAGGLAYGYRIRLEYDAAGERIGGRDIDGAEAEIIILIFEQYASGRTPLLTLSRHHGSPGSVAGTLARIA